MVLRSSFSTQILLVDFYLNSFPEAFTSPRCEEISNLLPEFDRICTNYKELSADQAKVRVRLPKSQLFSSYLGNEN